MTTPFPFTLGQTLTAAQMNAITELVVNDKTASYTLVAGDAGERVIMNSASATTITVNTSIFTAGQLIYVTNKGSGVCTITAGTATVSTTGTLALAQFASGVLYCISAGVFLFEAYGVAASAGGLTFLSATTVTAATSVSLPANTFSATYANYRIIFRVAASANSTMTGRFRAAGTDNTTAKYCTQGVGITSTSGANDVGNFDQTSFDLGYSGAAQYALELDLFSPQIAERTNMSGSYIGQNSAFDRQSYRAFGNLFDNTTSFDSFSIISSVASSLTGTVRVYGYANS